MLRERKPLQFEAREPDDIYIHYRLNAEFHQQVKEYYQENQIKMSQFVRYALARAIHQH